MAREAAQAAKTAAQRAEEALEAKFKEHQKARADELVSQQSAASVAKLGDMVADALPGIADYRRRWREIGQQPDRLDRRKATDKTIYGGVCCARSPEIVRQGGRHRLCHLPSQHHRSCLTMYT